MTGHKCDGSNCGFVTQSEDDHIITDDGDLLCLVCAEKREKDAEIRKENKMLKTHTHIEIHVVYEHPEDVHPDEVLENLDYSIGSHIDGVTIKETEIVSTEDTVTSD